MTNYRTTYVLIALIVLILNLGKLNLAQQTNRRTVLRPLKYVGSKHNKGKGYSQREIFNKKQLSV